jgi:hypothetical protein
MKPQNDAQAFALALALSVTAPESEIQGCIDSAELLAARMKPAQVRAVRDAVEICFEIFPLKQCH